MEEQVRDLLDQEESYKKRRIMATLESFRTWLDWLGLLRDVLELFISLADLYTRVRRWFGY